MRSDIVNRLFDATAEIMSATTLLFVFVDQTPARHASSTMPSATTGKRTEVLAETNTEMMMRWRLSLVNAERRPVFLSRVGCGVSKVEGPPARNTCFLLRQVSDQLRSSARERIQR